ncbi:CHAT domain-containing protein [Dactylosporangium sucinum]|uniref:CHAT domain-containing protein n=1 Tax=Dactylosporangium sucinum TaxID=1424081 RepID=A0A917UCI1_9ACTN|nr:CHAT domain-containing protein [Dactylosporangium sucinum]GGM73446.1 CHAT domain-containing protein [Dactylosporangium sucinum]
MGGVTAAELHQRAQTETERGRHAAARRLLHRALALDATPEELAGVLITLAYHEAERRGPAAGIELLDRTDALPGLPRRLRGRAASQRGLLLQRAGLLAEAAAVFDRAVGLLDEDEPEILCRNLLNRGLVHMRRGRHAAARADFARCAALARRHGLEVIAAKAAHNYGYLCMLSGDLPTALRVMDGVRHLLSSQSRVFAGVYHADRAQVLVAAGLFGDADRDLSRAAELFAADGRRQDLAEAELSRAELALLEERWPDARLLAARARRRCTGRGAVGWALLAAHVALAAAIGEGRSRGAAARAVALADRLAAEGLADEARRARLTAATALLTSTPAPAAHEPSAAGAADRERWRRAGVRAAAVAGEAVRLRARDPIATRLQARGVRAALAEARGDAAGADRERRAALADLHRYQASFGSLDLQTAVGSHARRLAADGLAKAVAGGRAAAVFGWAERARALSARLPPVLPPPDEEAARLLEELRHARAELRGQLLAGRADPRLRSRCARLEQQVRQRSWYTPGPAHTTAPASLGALRERLAADDATFVAHLLVSDGATGGRRLAALVVTGRRETLLDLGDAEPALEAHRRLRHDLDALALDTLPEPVRATVRAASRSALARLDRLLWAPLVDAVAPGPLLLAPSAPLAPIPWTLLPALRGRAVAVVPSVTAWLAARTGPALPAAPVVALAAGPGVARAAEELKLLADVWSPSGASAHDAGRSALAGRAERAGASTNVAATTAEVRAAAGRADVLHVAAHGTHEPDNPLFSHLDLADGPLFGYDLERLPRLPAHVVLSACELGLAGARPGDETLGMTVAMLHSGARSVVAGVALLSDAVACRVAPAHHAGLRRGLSPAAALAAAIAALGPDEDAPPLVCFGAGW